MEESSKSQRQKSYLLFDFVFHSSHSVFMWYQDLVSGTAKVAQDIISLVIQQDVFNLSREELDSI